MSYPKVTVVGAGQVGATTAFLLALRSMADVVLVDVVEGVAAGKALDMMHSRSVERFGPTVTGSETYEGTRDSDLVIVTAGLARKPGMTREELLAANAQVVGSVIEQTVALSPNAVFLCVTNPLDVMTYLAWKKSGLPSGKVLGMGGVLDSARFAYFIVRELGVGIGEVSAMVAGAHGEAMVPLPRHSTVSGRPLTDLVSGEKAAELAHRTVNGGAEVVALLKTGSAYYAPGASVARMASAILGDTGETMPSCVYLEGQYGVSGVYMSVPATLGRQGVSDVPELDLDEEETAALRASAATIAAAVAGLPLEGA